MSLNDKMIQCIFKVCAIYWIKACRCSVWQLTWGWLWLMALYSSDHPWPYNVKVASLTVARSKRKCSFLTMMSVLLMWKSAVFISYSEGNT